MFTCHRFIWPWLIVCLLACWPSPGLSADAKIGQVVAVEGRVSAEGAGKVRLLSSDDPVFAGEELISDADGRILIRFLDDAELALGPSSRIVLDRYVYDQHEANLLFSMGEGLFRMVTGRIAQQNPDGMELETPLAVIGIRGTTVGFWNLPGHDRIFALRLNPAVVGATNPLGSSSLTQEGTVIDVFANQPPSPPRPATPEELEFLHGNMIMTPVAPGEWQEGDGTDPQQGLADLPAWWFPGEHEGEGKKAREDAPVSQPTPAPGPAPLPPPVPAPSPGPGPAPSPVLP